MASPDLLQTVPRVDEVLIEGNGELFANADDPDSGIFESVLKRAALETVPPVVLDGLWRLLEDCQSAEMAQSHVYQFPKRVERVLDFEPFRLSANFAQRQDFPPRLTLRQDGSGDNSVVESVELIDTFSHSWRGLTSLSIHPSQRQASTEPRFGIHTLNAFAFLDRLQKETGPEARGLSKAMKLVHDRASALLDCLREAHFTARQRADAISVKRIERLDPIPLSRLIRERILWSAESGIQDVSASVEFRILEVLRHIDHIEDGSVAGVDMPQAVVQALQTPVPRWRVVLSTDEAA